MSNIEKSTYLKIEKVYADKFLNFIKKRFGNERVLDNRRLILYEEKYVYFPVDTSQIKKRHIKKIIEGSFQFELLSKKTRLNPNYRYKTLKDALKERIPKKFLKKIPNSYDIIGNIAILEFDQFKDSNINIKKQVAESLINLNNSILSVYEKKGIVKGIYRLRELELLYGEENSETIHKENGCQFKLDVKETYFSPRLVFERKRISDEAFRENEMIVDMFAGVGTFSIQIAKLNNVLINGFDINPEASKYFSKNIELNKIVGKITVHNLDVRMLLRSENIIGNELKGKADRIIMNLPEKSLDFIDVACFLMKENGGILHFYQFSEKPHSIENCITNLKKELNKSKWDINHIMNAKVVKAFSPKSDLVVVDLNISPIK